MLLTNSRGGKKSCSESYHFVEWWFDYTKWKYLH